MCGETADFNFKTEAKNKRSDILGAQAHSRGPLWTEVNGQAVLIGLLSKGSGCGQQPIIYTRVKKHLAWIFAHAQKRVKYTGVREPEWSWYRPMDHRTVVKGTNWGKTMTVNPLCQSSQKKKKKKRKKKNKSKKRKKNKNKNNLKELKYRKKRPPKKLTYSQKKKGTKTTNKSKMKRINKKVS